MNVRPLRDRVLVKRLEAQEQRIGGIIIPDTAREKPQQAKVIAVGRGRITDAAGRPVPDATVVTRTLDRNYWTLSAPSDAAGRYESFFPASDELGSDPVPMSVEVARGKVSHSSGFDLSVWFARLQSAVMDVRLTGPPDALPIPRSTPERGAIYRGLLVGVSGPDGIVRPLAARWPDAQGRFELVLPSSVRGERLRFWEDEVERFVGSGAAPASPVDVTTWPTSLDPDVPRDVATLLVPG